uniref:Uncharacterized protein n=1 Tax=Sphaerodactylus townsendi TaxID=933632 RepID=A0ACB8FSM6_9SAUR
MEEPDEGKGLVLDKDKEPCDPNSGDEEKDALIFSRHDPPLGAARSTSNGESMGSPYAWQFEDPFEEEEAWVRVQQIRQGSQSVSEYVSEFCQLAGVVQDWPEQVKIHFFQEGLHPEVAQWPW